MNKQELIEYCESLKGNLNKFINGIEVDKIIKKIEQLDEPQKPVVPRFVHKYIREARECNWDFQDLFKYIDDEDNEEFQKWFYHECNQETLAIAWINGYEVEKEKRYLVKIKSTGQCLGKYYINNEILSPRFIYTGRNADAFTRKELEEAGFGEVFNSPLFEVEEVE
nr:MAG TPA: Protein of unknown function (DUF1642) [Caudoviricetes sp.]